MIKLTTNCENCIHSKICRNKGNAKAAMNRLKDMTYGNGPNDDYDWDTIMECQHVDITFSCPDYRIECGLPRKA